MKYFLIGSMGSLALALNGCSSILGTTANVNQGLNPVFSGTKINKTVLERKECQGNFNLKKDGCPTDAMMPFVIVDAIPSAIMDVALLPMTGTIRAIQNQNEKKHEKK